MKRYQLLMLEWNLESVPLNEVDTFQTGGIGAGVGAGVGALGSGGVWAVKRLQLRKKRMACQGDPNCEAQVDAEIKALRNKALVGGAAATLGGAAIGGAAGFGHGVGVNYHDRKNQLANAYGNYQAGNRELIQGRDVLGHARDNSQASEQQGRGSTYLGSEERQLGTGMVKHGQATINKALADEIAQVNRNILRR